MPRGRKKGDHEARRTEIAEAACKVILRLGIANASLGDIAREMNYTTGILRHYFVDKDELLLFAKNMLFDRSFERARRAAALCEGIEKLRQMGRQLLPLDAEAIDRYRLLAAFSGRAIGNSRLMKIQHRRNRRHWQILADTITALQDAGVLPRRLDPNIEACGISALVEGLADQVIMSPGAWSNEELLELFDRHIESLRASVVSSVRSPAGRTNDKRRRIRATNPVIRT